LVEFGGVVGGDYTYGRRRCRAPGYRLVVTEAAPKKHEIRSS
jgi:hypothetical protein